MRIERLQAEWDITVRFVHFPLHPETPPEGLMLEQLFAGRNIDIPAAQARIKQLILAEGLPYGERKMTFNSRLAQELACYAVAKTGNDQIHNRLFQAYFVDGKNIASVETLIAIATDFGLAEDDCRDVVTRRVFRDAVDADWMRSRRLQLSGVPAFTVGDFGVTGAQPYDVLEQLVRQAGARRRLPS